MRSQRRASISGLTRETIILDFIHKHKTHNEIVEERRVPMYTVKRVLSKYMERRSEPAGDNATRPTYTQLTLFDYER